MKRIAIALLAISLFNSTAPGKPVSPPANDLAIREIHYHGKLADAEARFTAKHFHSLAAGTAALPRWQPSGGAPAWSCGSRTRAAVNRRTPNAGAVAGRFSDHAERLDCSGFSTALVSDGNTVCQKKSRCRTESCGQKTETGFQWPRVPEKTRFLFQSDAARVSGAQYYLLWRAL